MSFPACLMWSIVAAEDRLGIVAAARSAKGPASTMLRGQAENEDRRRTGHGQALPDTGSALGGAFAGSLATGDAKRGAMKPQ